MSKTMYSCQNCNKAIMYGVWKNFHYVCEDCTGSVIKVKCRTCNQTAHVTQSTLDEAEGWIECDCGGMCVERKYSKPAMAPVYKCDECAQFFGEEQMITNVCESCAFGLAMGVL